MTHPKISVLVSILSWDSPRYLSNLLDNLDALPPSITGEIDTHLHILDQGSADETRDLVREFVGAGGSRTATFLARNVGFARGHNHVFDLVHRQQPFDYFVVLNQDVLFGRPGWLDRLVDGMRDEAVAIGGPVAWQLCADPGVLMETCLTADRDPERIYSIQGSVAIIRSRAVERFGLFDNTFTPAYFEDTDLCRRYVHAGYRLGWIGVEHVHSYLWPKQKLVRQKKEALRGAFGNFHARNMGLFIRRWMKSTPPPITPETLPSLWPHVYRPAG